MRNFSTLAFILKKKIIGDQDSLVTIYGKHHGKMTAIAKGSQKITSRFTNRLELLTLNQCQLYGHKDYFLLTDCQVKKRWTSLKNPIQALQDWSCVSEIIDKTTEIGQENPGLFLLLRTTLEKLESSHGQELLILETFKIKLLKNQGLMPRLNNCHHCHLKLIDHETYFAPHSLALMCNHCHQTTPTKNSLLRIKTSLLNILSNLQTYSFDHLKNVNVEHNHLQEINRLNSHFLRHYLGKTLVTERIQTAL